MTGAERTLSIIAAVITIINFVIVFPSAVVETWLPLDIVKAMTIPTKLVIVTFLELSLAYAFGRLFAAACRFDDVNMFIVFVFVSVLSAWLTVFNLESLLIGRVINGTWEYVGFFVMLIITWLIAAVMINGHIESITGSDNNVEEGVIIQGIAFIFIFIALMFR